MSRKSRLPPLLASLVLATILGFTLSPSGVARPASQDLDLDLVIEILADTDDDELRLELLEGLREGLRGRKKVTMPGAWPGAYASLSKSSSEKVRQSALAIALIFDDPGALKELRRILVDREGKTAARLRALEALASRQTPDLAPVLLKLLEEKPLRIPALRALAGYRSSAIPATIRAAYPGFSVADRVAALTTLCSRPAFARELLGWIREGKLPREELTALHARQILGLGDEALAKLLREQWGDIRKTGAEKRKAIEEWKKKLEPAVLAKANRGRGRLVYDTTCARCHRLFDEGALIGPELTGSNRANLDYILENILDPDAAIGKGYRLTRVITRDGRILAGLLKARDEASLTLQTENGTLTLAVEDLLKVEESTSSMMPEGLISTLSFEQVRDLIAYLASSQQVPRPDPEKDATGS